MAKAGKLRLEQLARAQKLLSDLPEKDERKTREEGAEFLEKDFRKALRKGYTPKEISAMLKNEGIIIPAYLVEKFLKPENEHPRPQQKAGSVQKVVPKPVPGKKTETPPVAGKFTITPDTALEDL